MTANGNSENESMFVLEKMDPELQTFLKLAYEKERRDTFKNWIFSDDKKCNAAKLAEAGFYFVGNKSEPDAVQCIFCNKALDGWNEDDYPWQEHQQHSPKCQYIKWNKPESKLTVYELIELRFELTKNWIIKLFEMRKAKIVEDNRHFKRQLQDFKKQ